MPSDNPTREHEAGASFLFSDYFTDDKDPGRKIEIAWGGRVLTFRIKHSLTLGEKQRANNAAFDIKVGDDGKPVLSRQDQSAYTTEVLLAGLKYWPFEYERGKPVPINRETISQIDADLASAIAARILAGTKVNAEALDPFEPKSDAAS